MFKAYADFWKGYVDFTGRSSRSQYWYAVLVNILVAWLLLILFILTVSMVSDRSNSEGVFYLPLIFLVPLVLYGFAIALPTLAIRIRRLRDGGYHWALIFLTFVPFGSIALLVLYCLPSKPAPTDFNTPYQGQ